MTKLLCNRKNYTCVIFKLPHRKTATCRTGQGLINFVAPFNRIPQGSILGYPLFLICINDIPSSSDFFKYIQYANDTHYLVPFISHTDKIKNNLSEVYDWIMTNKLSLNVKRTKYIMFHAMNKPLKE